MATMENIFKTLVDNYTSLDKVKEDIRERRAAADVVIAGAQRAMDDLSKAKNSKDAVEEVYKKLKLVGPMLAAIEAAIPETPGSFYQFHDFWNNQRRLSTFIALFSFFVKEGKLADEKMVLELLGANFTSTTEDYLHAVCDTVKELPRYCIARVVKREFQVAKVCAGFATDLSVCLKELNLKNDSLRKNYDGVKYDVKRLNEIVYDLTIRGLLNSDEGEEVSNMNEKDIKMEDKTVEMSKQSA